MTVTLVLAFLLHFHDVAGIAKGPSCGVANRQGGRVVAGNETEQNEYPWTVSMTFYSDGSIHDRAKGP